MRAARRAPTLWSLTWPGGVAWSTIGLVAITRESWLVIVLAPALFGALLMSTLAGIVAMRANTLGRKRPFVVVWCWSAPCVMAVVLLSPVP